ncbi:MAG: TerB family tellurite resistance protein [Myxococcaceae bacterium]
MSALTAEDRFNIEVIKLLLQVAWADGEVDEREALMILGVGRSWNVPELELKELRERLEKGNPLPQPDMALLKTRSDEVLEAVRAMVFADGKLKRDEGDMVKQIAIMLGAKVK